MAFRRDQVTSNVEVGGDLAEILERKGEKYSLESLKYLEGKPTKNAYELVQNWLYEKKIWYEKMPTLIEKIEKTSDKGKVTLDELLKYFLDWEVELRKDIQDAFDYLEAVANSEDRGEIGQRIIEAVIYLEEKRGLVFQEIHSGSPGINIFLHENKIKKLLQKDKFIAEMQSKSGE